MSKLWTIANREFMVRVKSKSFILATLLTPLAFGAFFVISALIGIYSQDKPQKILVHDQLELTGTALPDSGLYQFEYVMGSKDEAKQKYIEEDYNAFISIIPPSDSLTRKRNASYLSKEKLGINAIKAVEERLESAMRKERIRTSGISQEMLTSFDINVNLENDDFINSQGKSSESKLNSIIGYALGFAMGFLMYMVIFVYGGMVMRSVMEEKINRIVEVIISSVKPFTLMLGKIIGVGGVGLVQILVWIVLIGLISTGVTMFFGGDAAAMSGMMNGDTQQVMDSMNDVEGMKILQEFMKLNWGMILPVFLVFFLGGYFIYSSLFAAIGAAVGDDMGEAQSLMFPIIIPVILAFVMLMPMLNNPNGGLAIFGSMFPLFSPILMPARLAFDPPWWQIAISILLLIGTVIGMIWVAGRIYRVGILLYGKKVNFKEIAKWMFYS